MTSTEMPTHLDRGADARGPICRVLAVVPGDERGTSMIFAKRQIESLKSAGIESATFFLRSRTSPALMLRELLRFRAQVRSYDPDIIHAHFGTATAMFCAIGTTRPLVITYRGSDLNPCQAVSPVQSAGGRFLSQMAALRSSRIVCVSGELQRRLWWRADRSVILPSGVDTRIFHPRDMRDSRRALAWSESERIVVFNAGKNAVGKRLDLAQAAVVVARSIVGPVRLFVLDGCEDPENIPMILCAADCLVITSDWEGSPNIVKEALACNLPVVSVDVGDVKERWGGTGSVEIVARSPQAIGEALAGVLKERRRSGGAQLVDAISQERVAERLAQLYQEVLSDARATRVESL